MSLREAIRTRVFTLTAELVPSVDGAALLAQATQLRGCVDAIQVAENQDGRAQMSSPVAASLLRQSGLDPVLHMTCRDRNRIALQGDLVAAASLGISSLLIMRGNQPPGGARRGVKTVFDFGATDLISAARAMREGYGPPGQGPQRTVDFFIGALATVFSPAAEWKPRTLAAKIDAGAQFVQTQLCFDVQALRHYMKRLVTARVPQRAHVLVGLAPLPSAAVARWLRRNLRGALMPAETIRRLEQARDPEQAGVDICAELLQQLAEIPGVSGASLMSPGHPDTIRAAIRASGLRADLASAAGQ